MVLEIMCRQGSRALWLGTVWAAGMVFAWVVCQNWALYQGMPTQVVVANPRANLDSVDFPAVTVCRNTKVEPDKATKLAESQLYPRRNHHVLNFIDKRATDTTRFMTENFHLTRMLGADADEKMINSYLNSLVILDLIRFPYYHYPLEYLKFTNASTYPIKNEDIPTIMKSVGPSIDDMFQSCYWRGFKHNCSNFFRFQRTEEGYCYSFNSKTGDRAEDSASQDHPKKPPYRNKDGSLEALRNRAAGSMTGIQFKLKEPSRPLQDHLSVKLSGYNIMVHSPEKFPDESHRFQIHESPDAMTRIMVTVSTVEGDQSLRDVPNEIRDCYWPPVLDDSEPVFSREDGHCRQYCRLKYITTTCNCVPYFFSTSETVIDTRTYCSVEHVECLAKANAILKNNGEETTTEGGFPLSNFTNVMNCYCTKPCSYVSYDTDQLLSYPNFPMSKNYWAYVDVSYKQPWVIQYNRYVKYSFQDFLVTAGSFAGLLLGGSLISILEIVYYLSCFVHHLVQLVKNRRARKDEIRIIRVSGKNIFMKNKVMYPFIH